MTDPRIEAAARALCIQNGHDPDGQDSYVQSGMDANWCAFVDDAKATLAAADAAAWRPMSEAPKDRTDILAKTRDNIYPEGSRDSGWNGRNVVIRHDGIIDGGFDMGWSVSAPVGYGGLPDEWFIGWQPINNGANPCK